MTKILVPDGHRFDFDTGRIVPDDRFQPVISPIKPPTRTTTPVKTDGSKTSASNQTTSASNQTAESDDSSVKSFSQLNDEYATKLGVEPGVLIFILFALIAVAFFLIRSGKEDPPPPPMGYPQMYGFPPMGYPPVYPQMR